jgi:hypothetical protein
MLLINKLSLAFKKTILKKKKKNLQMPSETYLKTLIYSGFTNNKDTKVNFLFIISLFSSLLYLNLCSVYNFFFKLISLVYIKLAINATLASTHIIYYIILKLLI